MRDEHTHCPCNGVWLCRTCHAWAHKNPIAAREAGYIVSRYVLNPGGTGIDAYFGRIFFECDGTWHYGRIESGSS